MKSSSSKRKEKVDADKVAVLNGWHRVDTRTREALRRSFLSELVEGYEFYNLVSVTDTEMKGTQALKMTRIRKKKTKTSSDLLNITLSDFLKMTKEGIW
ncbi:hypothetical protein RJ641_031014 [Dillenia turbinata]|uniref:Uncharacterized protein n=1 Tax=Dillenia turbinata TaxID=194707 RepID=A0AAN8VWQ6_9MAGN